MSDDAYLQAQASHERMKSLIEGLAVEHQYLWTRSQLIASQSSGQIVECVPDKVPADCICIEGVPTAIMFTPRQKLTTPRSVMTPSPTSLAPAITPRSPRNDALDEKPTAISSKRSAVPQRQISPSDRSLSHGVLSDERSEIFKKSQSRLESRYSGRTIKSSMRSHSTISSDATSALRLNSVPFKAGATSGVFSSATSSAYGRDRVIRVSSSAGDFSEDVTFSQFNSPWVEAKQSVNPSALYRLMARLGKTGPLQCVTAAQLYNTVKSLGLERISEHRMQTLVFHMRKSLGYSNGHEQSAPLSASGEATSPPPNKSKTKLLRLQHGFSMASFGVGDFSQKLGVADSTMQITVRELFKILSTESERASLGPESQSDLLIIKEVLLSGDTNRLVAELTSVRIDDLAAPPPKMDWESIVEPLVGFVILLNGIIIGVQTEEDFETWRGWVWVEIFFTSFFTIEICMRIWTQGFKGFYFGPAAGWSFFDTAVVITAIFDTMVDIGLANVDFNPATFTVIRTVRLTRIARLFRVFRLKCLRDLNVMIKGLFAGFQTLFWALVLLFFTIYIISIFTTYTLGRSDLSKTISEEQLFTSVPKSMLTCFRCFVGDCTTTKGESVVKMLSDVHGVVFVLAYLASFTIVTLGLFNLIMALYVEITMAAAKSSEDMDKQRRDRESLRVAHCTKKLLKKFCIAHYLIQDPDNAGRRFTENEDVDEDMIITKDQFLILVQGQDVQTLMDELDIPPDRANLFDILDADGTGDLHVSELVHGLLKVRGEARKSDVIASLLGVRAVQDMLRLMESKLAANQEIIINHLGLEVSAHHQEKLTNIWTLKSGRLPDKE